MTGIERAIGRFENTVKGLHDDMKRQSSATGVIRLSEMAEDFIIAIAALREKAERENGQGGWINVKDGLPEADGVYQVYAPTYRGGSSRGKEHHDGRMYASYRHGRWSIEHGYYDRPGCVTHWQPLPEPPMGGA